MASALEEWHTGDTDFIKVIATNLLGPTEHLGHQIAQTGYLFPRPPCWGKRVPLNGSVLSQLSPFTASTMAPRTIMSVCSVSM